MNTIKEKPTNQPTNQQSRNSATSESRSPLILIIKMAKPNKEKKHRM
jgi:hypothetical protein